MDFAIIFSIVLGVATLSINVCVVVAGAVWVVGRISTTTGQLTTSIVHMTQSIDSLKGWIGKVDDNVDQAKQRLAVVETEVKQIREDQKKAHH